MKDLLADVRWTMIDQAMALTSGNRQRSADLLQVSRQAIQQVAGFKGRMTLKQPRKDERGH